MEPASVTEHNTWAGRTYIQDAEKGKPNTNNIMMKISNKTTETT